MPSSISLTAGRGGLSPGQDSTACHQPGRWQCPDGMSCYSHPCAADGPSTSRGTEPAPAWDEMPSILPCFWSANCFLCELPVHSPGCSCGSRDTVSQHCPAAPKATASHPHSARTWNRSTDTNSQNPAPIQALLPWSQGHNRSPPGASVGVPSCVSLRTAVIRGQGSVNGDHKGPLQ